MKRKNLLLNSNILENKFFNSNNNTLIGDVFMRDITKRYKETGKLNFEDHEQRMFMDGEKNMLEALLAGDRDTAERYSRMHKDLADSFETYKNMEFKELLQERINQRGYSPSDEIDDELQEILDSL